MTRVAAFDLGSNSFLCLVADRNESGLRVVHDQLVVTGLGAGLSQSGVISRLALQRAEDALCELVSEAQKYHVERMVGVATSAARDAKNGSELLGIAKKLGVEVEVISGESEALLTFWGAVGAKLKASSDLVVDVGGFSTEIAWFENGAVKSKSFDFGCLRNTELFFSSLPPSKKDLESATNAMKNLIGPLAQEVKSRGRLLAVAGTATSLAQLQLGLKTFNAQAIEGVKVTKADLSTLLRSLVTQDLKALQENECIDRKRARVLPMGALILHTIMEGLNYEELFVSTRGVRFGLAMRELGLC